MSGVENAAVPASRPGAVAGLVAGVVVAAGIWHVPWEGLSPEGGRALALMAAAVIWWAARVMPAGYTALALLTGLALAHVAPPAVVFGMFTGPVLPLVAGGYLLAAAVGASGLGTRIAHVVLRGRVRTYRELIVTVYVLTFLLSVLIPQPWPRAFLLMGVIAPVIAAAGLSREDAAGVGLAVFAGSAPVSMILLTGDSTINVLATTVAGGAPLGWLEWVRLMGVPGVAASVLCCVVQLRLFPGPREFRLDPARLPAPLAGRFTPVEARTAAWLGLAVLLWLTGPLHGVPPGWVAAGVAAGLALPGIGGVLGPAHWRQVPVDTLLFLAAAVALGRVGGPPVIDPVTGGNTGGTGLSAWLAGALLPAQPPDNPFLFAALVAGAAMALHLVVGSVAAALGVAGPALAACAAPSGVDPVVPALIVYTVTAGHWILPFHHMNLLIGLGPGAGGYTEREAMRLGVRMTAVVLVVVLAVEVPWWMLLGVW